MTREETALALRIGEAIRRARKVRGWSQAKLASRLSVSNNHVGNIERGKGLPSVGMLATIAQLLNLSIDAVIVSRSERPTTSPAEFAKWAALFDGIAPELRPLALRLLKDFARLHQSKAVTLGRRPKMKSHAQT